MWKYTFEKDGVRVTEYHTDNIGGYHMSRATTAFEDATIRAKKRGWKLIKVDQQR